MKRIFTMLLALVLLVTCLPNLTVFATEAGTQASTQELHASEALLNIIKQMEGFSAKPFWDYQQWSVGYGCWAGSSRADGPEIYADGITLDEADALLRKEVKEKYEDKVKAFAAERKWELSQNQFDALVSFTYNLGTQWMYPCKVTVWIDTYLGQSNWTPEQQLSLVQAFGSWARAGGTCLPGLCRRRINEARMFLYGDYTGTSSQQYYYIVYHAVKSKMGNGYEDMASYYVANKPIGTLPTPNKVSGYTFLGWFTSAGVEVTSQTVITKDMELYARWKDESGNIVTPDDTDNAGSSSGTSNSIGSPAPTEPEKPSSASEVFQDVMAGSWYEEYVTYVYEKGLFGGMTETTFEPNSPLTRAMLVTVLYRHAGEPAVEGRSSFADVPDQGYYVKAVAWAEKYGIVDGVSATEFAPKDNITREQFATILYRYCVKYQGITPTNSADLNGFSDQSQIHNYALESMAWAVGNGIINGVSETELNPRGNATRAQTAAMLTRMIQNILY